MVIREPGRLRNEHFLEKATEKYVKPLYESILIKNPGFDKYDYHDRFLYLVKVNNELIESDAALGDSLMLDFGPSWCMVFSGKMLGNAIKRKTEELGTVKFYAERFVSNVHRNRSVVDSLADWGNVGAFLEHEHNTYADLAIPYQVALISLYLTQNLPIFPEDATRYVVTGGEYGTENLISGISYQYWIDEDNRFHGWDIRLDDAKPKKDFMTELARDLRENSFILDSCYGEGEMVAEHKVSHRANQTRTDDLVYFVGTYLPSRGVTPGKGFSWEKTRQAFFKEYPKYKDKFYPTATAFSKAYKQAAARRAGGNHG